MLLQETLAVLFSLGKLCEDHGYTYHCKKRSKTISHQKLVRELIAIYQIVYHLWFLEKHRVLPLIRLHLSRHHLHHRSQNRLTEIKYQKTEVWKLQYQKEVEVRMKSFGDPLQKPKTNIKRRNRRMYQKIFRMNCLIGCRISRRIWLMKVLRRASGKPDAEKCRHFHFVS